MDALLADDSWHNLAVFAHGGTNAAILGWATGVGLQAFGLLDQATCCLNIIDFDTDDSGAVMRKTVRGMNITADDPVKHGRDAGDRAQAWLRASRSPGPRSGRRHPLDPVGS